MPTPRYRHHFLLLEPARATSSPSSTARSRSRRLRAHHDGPSLCGVLAHAAGLLDVPSPCAPRELIADFAWDRVPTVDRLARLDPGAGLVIG